jgi:3-hydroxyacyl-[acyl-carrier-protein] dehydratase
MILQNDFYTILQPGKGPGSLQAILELNPDHPIFKGHFPGQPVVPGVCMLQMLKELLEIAVGRSTQLAKGHELKFLSVIDPQKNNLINVELSYEAEGSAVITVAARFFCGEITFFKFKGLFNAR